MEDTNNDKKKKQNKNQVVMEPPPEEEPVPRGMKTAAQKKQEKKLRDKEKRKNVRNQDLITNIITEEPIPEEAKPEDETPQGLPQTEEPTQKKSKKRNAMAAKLREAILIKEREEERLRAEAEARRLKEEEEERLRKEAEEKARIALEESKRQEREMRKKQIAENKLANSKLSKDRQRLKELIQRRGQDATHLTKLPGVKSNSVVPIVENTVVSTSEPVVDEEFVSVEEENFEVYKGNSNLSPEERIKERREYNKQRRCLDNLRAPVVCVLGHVDTGKTKILDRLRQTNVQDAEAGGITQQIGATNVPMYEIVNKTAMVNNIDCSKYKFPGLLIIDTPGHESFSNLRSRGSSLCDIAILVVDVMHGIQKQTIESIKLLIKGNTPFIVALNKVDRISKWKDNPDADIRDLLSSQEVNSKLDFESRFNEVFCQFAVQGLNVALFYENDDMNNCASVVPTSACSGDGMGNLITLVCDICQDKLARRLRYSEEVDATVMEVKTITGLGTTLDLILVNGRINEGDTIVAAGQEGPIVTSVRALLTPPPMKELRIKSNYIHHKSLKGARGMKLTAKSLEGAIAGLPLFVAYHEDEIEICAGEVADCLKNALGKIKLSEQGVYVQASTLGSLEALTDFLSCEKIPFCGINVGPVHKKDVVHASVMLEKCKKWAVVLAFDVPIDKAAQELADVQGVQIFKADIIYHLFDKLTNYIKQECIRVKNLYRSRAVFPCRLKILPDYIIKTRDPIILGVVVEVGTLFVGTPICVTTGLFLGHVASIESGNCPVDNARKGSEVSIKIVFNGSEGKKMYGRHFTDKNFLVSQVTRESIDILKDYFREDLNKNDWKLILELKTIFGIV